MKIEAAPFLTSALDRDERSASRLGSYTHGERIDGTYWIGGLLGPRAGQDAVENKKFLLDRESNPDRPARIQSLYRLSQPGSYP
jgi:hypothetical protein